MSNSPLVNYTKISPHIRTRTGTISKITIHHMAGVATVEECGGIFQGTRVASSHYGIDSDGRVGQYADEKYRTVTSSSTANDNVAVTIEVSNSKYGEPWPVSDKALEKLIELCVDICQRNGIPKLTYTGNSTGNLTRHNMFAATACPGPYLQERFPYIADEVNKRLGNTSTPQTTGGDINEKYRVNVSSTLNCRAEASAASSILGSFQAGEIVTATKRNGNWLYVSNGKLTGWSSADYLVQLTVKSALDKLVKEGIINSPESWLANYSKINYLDQLIINMGYADKTANESTSITTAEAAIDKMVTKGLINSPDYWKTNYKNLAWLDVFFIKVANRL